MNVMNLLHCKTRRYTYGALSALVILGTATLALAPRLANADDQNPTVLNVTPPELSGAEWINTPHNAPLTLAARKGKVTIVHFWTFGCINCKHNLPAYARWQKQFAGKDVAIIGVHTPETKDEAVSENVRSHVRDYGITYPVLIDGKGANWHRWQQRYWPTVYLIDKKGKARYAWEGELEYNNQDGTRKVTELVNELLNEK